MQTWRLLVHDPAPGAWNMAVDEAMLEAYRDGLVPPTLRLYDWKYPTLSLGYAQSDADVDAASCRELGVEIVRRPTGGRAVLHGVGDLTYAVVASEREGFPASVSGSYCRLAKALAGALASLGTPVELAPGSRTTERSAACFAVSTEADLTAGGKKLVGGAQMRRAGGFMQHGAIMVSQAPEAIAALLHSRRVPEAMTHLEALLGHKPSRPEVEAAILAGFEQTFGLRFERGDLTERERKHARELSQRSVLAAR